MTRDMMIDAAIGRSMLSRERLAALHDSTARIVDQCIPGPVVMCGVAAGGAAALVGMVLEDRGDRRDVWLFDTFEGMAMDVTPDDIDINGTHASKRAAPGWMRHTLESVKAYLSHKRYKYVRGNVLNTIPDAAPDQIALLHLDTDFYKSTLHELAHLFPRLAPGGVCLVDDYGHWQGAKKAVDEYAAFHGLEIEPIDYTGIYLRRPTC
jgi:O-methyltransferase